MEILWTYRDEQGELADLECESRLHLTKFIDVELEENNQDLANGEVVERELKLVRFYYDDILPDKIILGEEPYTASIEGYHGDIREHGTYWGQP